MSRFCILRPQCCIYHHLKFCSPWRGQWKQGASTLCRASIYDTWKCKTRWKWGESCCNSMYIYIYTYIYIAHMLLLYDGWWCPLLSRLWDVRFSDLLSISCNLMRDLTAHVPKREWPQWYYVLWYRSQTRMVGEPRCVDFFYIVT